MNGEASVASALYREYFANPTLNVQGMSSHWRAYAAQSSVRVDPQGVPVRAFGVGFGDMSRRRPGNAPFTAIAAVLHSLQHPAKRRVPGALSSTWRVAARARLVFNQDALRQALSLAFLMEHLENEPLRRIALIGDGYGLLGAALAKWRPNAQIVFFDLGRSLLFQAMTCGRVFPSASNVLIGHADDSSISSSRFVYCPADRLDQWTDRQIDLAVNIASMQEMTADVIEAYFTLLRRAPTTWLYCCNRERKVMPQGEVSEFAGYPWTPDDTHIVDGLCPWHQWFVAPRRSKGLIRVSLRAPYDGPHMHRLSRLASRVASDESASPRYFAAPVD